LNSRRRKLVRLRGQAPKYARLPADIAVQRGARAA
jgi:hypothetical protein